MTYIKARDSVIADAAMSDLIARMARQAGDAQAAAIERALLEGGDRIEVGGYFGMTYVYALPSWRRHPIHRARITAARLRYRLRGGVAS